MLLSLVKNNFFMWLTLSENKRIDQSVLKSDENIFSFFH